MKSCCRTVLALAWLVSATAAPGAPFAYVANDGSRSVSVLDTATGLVTATIATLPFPRAIAVNPAGTRAYVAHIGSGSLSVSVIDTATNAVVAALPIFAALPDAGLHGGRAGDAAAWISGTGIAVSPADPRVYAAAAGNPVAFVDSATNTAIATVDAGLFACGVAVHPAGTRVYVADWWYGALHVIDANTRATVARIDLSMFIDGVAVNHAGTRVYVADAGGYVWVLDTAANAVVARIPVDGGPVALAVAPGDRWVYASIPARNEVAVIDAANVAVTGRVAVGSAPLGIAASRDGTRVHVANSGSNDVSSIDIATNTVVATATVGSFPFALAVGPAVVAPDRATTIVEFHHASLDHYFITWMPDEIALLDAGTQIKGWRRTGYGFRTYITAQAGTSPVCRYYIPPGLGDSHFFGRGTTECVATGQKFPSFVLEDPAFMQMFLPVAGVCPAGTTQVYRLFSNRADANHRYTNDRAVRDLMVQSGWQAEGDGSDLVVMCAPP